MGELDFKRDSKDCVELSNKCEKEFSVFSVQRSAGEDAGASALHRLTLTPFGVGFVTSVRGSLRPKTEGLKTENLHSTL